MKYKKKPVVIEAYQTDKELDIETLEGTMHASPGDYIITGVSGEQYPCKPDIFKKTYEEISEEISDSDLISRQSAIKWVKTECNPYGKPTLDLESGEKVIEHLKRMRPAQQWIPLSTNQLPDEGQEVFIQFKEGRQCPHFKVQVGYLGKHEVEHVYFEKIGVKKVWYTDQYYYDLDRVVAWMPRPELYKEKEDETN